MISASVTLLTHRAARAPSREQTVSAREVPGTLP
ncbi:hypothetical protein TPSea814_000629a [Treponema pallidum subsp. pallidum str. Sea 81-4]|nr:hypothetical protein TPSea814_000629a [Treponema pallidum subsp. pallidum str. Sea 81-4]